MSNASPSLGVIVGADDSTAHGLLFRTLRWYGHDIHHVGDAAALWKFLEIMRPDFIVVMATTDDGTEFDLCRAIRASDTTRTTPILVISRRGSVSQRMAACSAGADEFLETPFKAATLRAHIRGMLAMRNTPDRARAMRRAARRANAEPPKTSL